MGRYTELKTVLVLFRVFVIPSHLNGFELRLVRRLWIVVKTIETEDPLAEIGKTQRQGIDARIFLSQSDGDIFGVVPLHGETSWALRSLFSDLPS